MSISCLSNFLEKNKQLTHVVQAQPRCIGGKKIARSSALIMQGSGFDGFVL